MALRNVQFWVPYLTVLLPPRNIEAEFTPSWWRNMVFPGPMFFHVCWIEGKYHEDSCSSGFCTGYCHYVNNYSPRWTLLKGWIAFFLLCDHHAASRVPSMAWRCQGSWSQRARRLKAILEQGKQHPCTYASLRGVATRHTWAPSVVVLLAFSKPFWRMGQHMNQIPPQE